MQSHQNLTGRQPATKKLRWLSAWLILSLACSLLGCGPKITACLSDPVLKGFQCYNEKTHSASFVLYEKTANYVATPALDYQHFIACQAKEITICISDPSSMGFSCHDERTHSSFFLTYIETENFIGMPPLDYDELLLFQRKKCNPPSKQK